MGKKHKIFHSLAFGFILAIGFSATAVLVIGGLPPFSHWLVHVPLLIAIAGVSFFYLSFRPYTCIHTTCVLCLLLLVESLLNPHTLQGWRYLFGSFYLTVIGFLDAMVFGLLWFLGFLMAKKYFPLGIRAWQVIGAFFLLSLVDIGPGVRLANPMHNNVLSTLITLFLSPTLYNLWVSPASVFALLFLVVWFTKP